MISRSRHIICIFLSMAFLLIAESCINDRFAEDSDSGVEGSTDSVASPVAPGLNTVGYMSISLQRANGITRGATVGDEFDYGSDEEFRLASGQHHFAIFYKDGQDTPVAVAALSSMSEGKEGNTTSPSTVVLATIAAKSEQKSVLEELKECIVILNTDIEVEQLMTTAKDALLNTIVKSPYYKNADGKEFFTMSNAVYVDNAGQKVITTKVDTEKIYSSYMEALEQAWKGNAAVNAYVERLTAKFSLEFSNNSYNNSTTEKIFIPKDNKIVVFSHLNNDGIPYYDEPDDDDDAFSYKIRITGWGINALEKESYLFRKIDAKGGYFDGWYKWYEKESENDYSRPFGRTYWSEDCNYTRAVYPWQYRRAVDKAEIPYYAGHSNILQNLSYTELNANGFGKKYLYAPENTYDFKDAAFKSSLDSRIELLAGTHLIVCAELLTNLDDINIHKAKDVYRDRNGIFYRSEKECFKALVTVLNNTIKSRSFLKYTYYNWDNGGGKQTLYAKTHGEYSLYYNGIKLTQENIDKLSGVLTSDAFISNGDGQRLVWMDGMSIRDDMGNPVEIYSNIDEVDEKKNVWLREATIDDIKSILFEYTGAIDHFKDGKMYYAVPVGLIKDEANSTEQMDQYSVYGVVRNCQYSIQIEDVTGLGTSVDNDAEPIVPNKVSTHDHLFISFKILDWHLTEQNVPGVIN